MILDAQLISLNELTVIASFLTSKEAYLQLQKVRLCKPSSNETVNPPRVEVAGTSRLLRLLIKFIVKSHGLLGIFLESFTISPDSLDKLGMSISKSKSSKLITYSLNFESNCDLELTWLSLRHCHIGDSGLSILGPHLKGEYLRVLLLEYCGLTSISSVLLGEIVKVG